MSPSSFPPIVHRSVRGQERGRAFVAPHDQFEEVLGRGVRQLAHAEMIDDEQWHRRQLREVVFAGTGERRLGQFFEQRVGLAVDDAIPLENRGAADRLAKWLLPVPGGPRKRTSSRCAMKRAVASS